MLKITSNIFIFMVFAQGKNLFKLVEHQDKGHGMHFCFVRIISVLGFLEMLDPLKILAQRFPHGYGFGRFIGVFSFQLYFGMFDLIKNGMMDLFN